MRLHNGRSPANWKFVAIKCPASSSLPQKSLESLAGPISGYREQEMILPPRTAARFFPIHSKLLSSELVRAARCGLDFALFFSDVNSDKGSLKLARAKDSVVAAVRDRSMSFLNHDRRRLQQMPKFQKDSQNSEQKPRETLHLLNKTTAKTCLLKAKINLVKRCETCAKVSRIFR